MRQRGSEMGTRLAGVLVLLFTQWIRNSSATSSCWVTESRLMYITAYQQTITCCETWCFTNCTKAVSVQKSVAYNVATNTCCDGYGGPECLPECIPACNFNEECASPSNCSCAHGWMGTSCNQVAGYQVENTTSSSVTLSWIIPDNSSLTEHNVHYQITCSPQQGGPTLHAVLSHFENSITLSPLQDSKKYRCCIKPVFFGLEGIPSCIDTITFGYGVIVTVDQETALVSISWHNLLSLTSSCYTFSLLEISAKAMPVKSWNVSNSTQDISDFLHLDPYIPYSFEMEVSLEDQTSLLSSAVFFVNEMAPSFSPVVSTAERSSPESISIKWNPLPLYQSRGFVTAYIIEYSESVVGCNFVANTRSMNTTEHAVTLTDINLQAEYCVAVAAATSAGIGPFSNQSSVPVFNNSFFRVEVSGVSDCLKWVTECTAGKISDFVYEMLKYVNTECQHCQLSSNQFGLLQLICKDFITSSNFASLQGRIVGSGNVGTSEIIDFIQHWVNTSPVVVIGGGRYTVTAQCAVSIDTIGTSLCSQTSEVSSVGNETGWTSTLVVSMAALVISMVDLALITVGLATLIIFCVCQKHMVKREQPRRDTDLRQYSDELKIFRD